jgi:enterochelin esterase-like enzyme
MDSDHEYRRGQVRLPGFGDQGVTLDEASPGGRIRGGPAALPARRWLVVALGGVVIAVLAAGGIVGASRYVSAFWLYRGFAPPSAPHSVMVGGPAGARRVPVVLPTVQSITVPSPALVGYADPVYVVLPPGYASHPGQRYPVLYLLHGFPGLSSGFLNIGQVATTEATLVAAGRMKPVILVMPTGTRSFLADQEWVNGIRRGNGWETFVARDLVKAMDSRYRTIPSARGRGIAGLSEGGYGALNIGLHHAGEFGLVESWSGYMRADPIPAIFGGSARLLAYNSPAVWAPSVAPRLRAGRTYIWFYIGAADPLAAQNRAFAAELSGLGVAHHFFERPGTHSWRLWRSQMAQALITASGHLSHG